jgi:hypothetical protein
MKVAIIEQACSKAIALLPRVRYIWREIPNGEISPCKEN